MLRAGVYVAVLALAGGGLPVNGQNPAVAGPSGGIYDPTLEGYVSGQQEWNSRGLWYNIIAWAARTSNCVNNATSMACMACSMDLPAAAVANGVAPIAVGNGLWFSPARGAVCGMCMKVYMPNGTTTASASCPTPSDANSGPGCAGQGLQPYVSTVSSPANYGSQIFWDPARQMSYFIAMAVEWLDRNQTDDYTLSHPTMQADNVDAFGTWPVIYEGVPCPGADQYPLQYQFQDYSQPAVTGGSSSTAWTQSGSSIGLPPGALNGGALCNNLANQPCGEPLPPSTNPLSYIKLQITGERIPLSGVDIQLNDGQWESLTRSGDGYWQGSSGSNTAYDAMNIRVYCSDGSPPKIESNVIPANMLCAYQDPTCQRWTGTVQC